MQVDLFTVIAQIVNFIILVIILRLVLYKRIIEAMNKREENIKDDIEEAEEKKKKAENIKKAYDEKNRELDNQKDDIIKKVKQEAEEKKKDMLEKAKKETKEQKKRWESSIEDEKTKFLDNFRKEVANKVCDISKKVLNDLADEELEKHIIKTFIKKLKNLSKEEKKEIENLSKKKSINLLTTFDLKEKILNELKDALNTDGKNDIEFELKKSKDLICGITLITEDNKISWDINDYITSLEKTIQNNLKQNIKG